MQQVAILTTGLWRLRHEIAVLTGMRPVRWDRFPRPSFDAVAGWGHAATADRARRLARRSGKPYLAIEDGPLRSIRPGPGERPLSMVLDRSGIYYRAAEPSDLLALMTSPEPLGVSLGRAEQAFGFLRQLRLSKYNAGPERSIEALGLSARASRRILVLDQVENDASISGASADAGAFATMLNAALQESAAAEVVVKLHPDVLSGRRSGYFAHLVASDRLRLVADQTNPWSLLDAVDVVYTVSSGLGFEAALAGKRVVCFGAPYYAGWGFTDDRGPKANRPRRAEPLELFAAYYLRYSRYLDAYSRREVSFEEAAAQLAWLRDRFFEQKGRAVCFGVTHWKRRAVDRMLDGPAGPPLHAATAPAAVAAARRSGTPLAVWASRENPRLERACAKAGVNLMRIEDGFIRSAGLGASFVTPLSLVFDRSGIYYDARTPSDLELLLQNGEFPPALLKRAQRLRQMLIAAGTTKYNVVGAGEIRIESRGRPVILVPGQVEDDASIRRGAPVVASNLGLLRAARARHPHGCIVYKPHPDVEAGLRRGRVPPQLAEELADFVASRASILGLIAAADRVETLTSLAGFEALLRGKPVTTHGQPFYAGWGLTEDLCPLERRTRWLSLDELVAAALILYPRYVDPVSGLRCRPELLVERLAAATARPTTISDNLMRLAKLSAGRALHVGRSVRPRRTA
jgi:capsular polysaccharide export protein